MRWRPWLDHRDLSVRERPKRKQSPAADHDRHHKVENAANDGGRNRNPADTMNPWELLGDHLCCVRRRWRLHKNLSERTASPLPSSPRLLLDGRVANVLFKNPSLLPFHEPMHPCK